MMIDGTKFRFAPAIALLACFVSSCGAPVPSGETALDPRQEVEHFLLAAAGQMTLCDRSARSAEEGWRSAALSQSEAIDRAQQAIVICQETLDGLAALSLPGTFPGASQAGFRDARKLCDQAYSARHRMASILPDLIQGTATADQEDRFVEAYHIARDQRTPCAEAMILAALSAGLTVEQVQDIQRKILDAQTTY